MRSNNEAGRRFVKRTFWYLLAFVLPAILVGTIVTFLSVSEWMTVKAPESLSQEFPEPPVYDPAKPTAVVLVSNQGTESTDLLASYEILAASGALNVYTVAPKRVLSPIWHGVDILPHYSFQEIEQKLTGSFDLILIPNIADPEDSTIVQWVKRNARESTWIVSVCEGARVLAASGLLDNRRASSHFMALGQLEEDYPMTSWIRGVRYVEDRNIITSAGVTASIDATFHALHRVVGLQVAQQTAQRLNYHMELHPREVDLFNFKLTDFFSLFLTAGYLWDKTYSGVLIFDGIGEVDLGSVLDLYPRVLDGTVVSIAPVRKFFRSRNGLDLVPWWSFERTPSLDELLITDDLSSTDRTNTIQEWIESKGIEPRHPQLSARGVFTTDKPLFIYDLVVQDIARRRSKAVARAVSKTVEYPINHIELSGSSWPFQLILIPLGVGLVGVGIGRWFEKKFVKS